MVKSALEQSLPTVVVGVAASKHTYFLGTVALWWKHTKATQRTLKNKQLIPRIVFSSLKVQLSVTTHFKVMILQSSFLDLLFLDILYIFYIITIS